MQIIAMIFRRKREKTPIPCTELAVPGRESVIFDNGIRRVYKCYTEEIGSLSVTPEGLFVDADGIIVGGVA